MKLIPSLRFLNPPNLAVTRLSMKLGVGPTSPASGFSRVFPFKLKYLWFGPPQPGTRSFSTRSFRSRHAGSSSVFAGRRRMGEGGEVRASKSLVEDEAELSDWVSDLRTNSFRSGRVSSEDESESGSSRGRQLSGRYGERDGDRGFRSRDGGRSRRRDRESGRGREGFSNWKESKLGRRFDSEEEEERFDSRRKSSGRTEVLNGKRGRRERDFGGGRERYFEEGRDARRVSGKRKFLDDDEDEEDERLAGSLGDLLREGEGDADDVDEDEDRFEDDDDIVLNKNAGLSPGLEKDTRKGVSETDGVASPESSGSYLSETR